MDIREFLTARLAEDEWWARNAGGCFGNVPPETGEHWHWVESRGDTPITPDPTVGELLDDGGADEWRSLALRSVEQYPMDRGGTLPSFIISTAEEVNTVGGGHIVRHDPARVLRDVEAKRRLLRDMLPEVEQMAGLIEHEYGAAPDRVGTGVANMVLRLVALSWSDHPDFDPTWSTESVIPRS